MASRTRPPFRADHVGSLLRPPELLQAREQHKEGSITDEQLRAVEDDAIAEVVRRQEEVGLQTATDGEFRRDSWSRDFIYQLGGVEMVEGGATRTWHSREGDIEHRSYTNLRVNDKLRLQHPIFGDHFKALRELPTTATAKLTIPSPSMIHFRGGAAINREVYPDMDVFWSDLAGVYADQVKAVADLGCRYLQFDDTSLAHLNDPKQREAFAEKGGDPETAHLSYIAAINEAIREKPDEMAVTTHLCRGNYRSSWVSEGSYDYVAEALFNELNVDGFFLEFDDERSGGFEPLRFLPKGKQVVLGLVTTKRGELESADGLKRRIEEASKVVPLDQLCLSPQCGFSSTSEGNDLTRDEQFAKLRLIVETAQDVWG